MQIKSIMRYHLISTGIVIIKRKKQKKVLGMM